MRLVLDVGKKYPVLTGSMPDLFSKELYETCERDDFDELHLDFDGINLVSSVAIGAIFASRHYLKKRGKDLRVVNASDSVVHLFRMVNLVDVLT